MTIHEIVLVLLESGVALQWDGTDWRALIGNVWIRLEPDEPVMDVPVDIPAPELIAA